MVDADLNPLWLERYAAERDRMRAHWLKLLGPHAIMPREVMMPVPGTKGQFNEEVCNAQQFFRVVERYAPRCDVKVGWSPSNQYESGEMTWAFGDIDEDGDLDAALAQARRYEEHAMSEWGVQPPAIYTAGKGFHMHIRHDPVPVGRAYSDALRGLLTDSGVKLDPAPLKHRYAKPRLPYTLNLKATGINKRAMYVVPVDLTWDLDEIRRASAEIQVHNFRIPHSPVLADLLRPAIEKEQAKALAMSKLPVKRHQKLELVETAIAFCESDGLHLVDSRGRPDGRRRLLQTMYIPALMEQHDGNVAEVVAVVEAWVEATGGRWRDYRNFVEQAAKKCWTGDGILRSPMGLQRFWSENPGLRIAPAKRTTPAK